MSYNGTVRCGHCYTRGHNRRSCKDYTKKLKDLAENSKGDYLKDHYNQEYIKRTGKNADGSEPQAGLKPKKARRQCGWCKKHGFSYEDTSYGHNRQTCPNRKEWIVAKIEESQRLRAVVRSRARTFGLGIGTLIKTDKRCYNTNGEYVKRQVIGMIVKIAWNKVDVSRLSDDRITQVRWIGIPDDPNGYNKNIVLEMYSLPRALYPSDIADRSGYMTFGSKFEVVGKSSHPLATCPDDWETQKITLDESNV